LRRYAEAVQSFEETERLAPGWYYCRTYRWLAKELAAKRLAHEVFQGLMALQDGPMPPKEKVELAETMLAAGVDLALLRLFLAENLRELGRSSEAEAHCRRGLEMAAEPDVKTRVLLELGAFPPLSERKRRYLQEAVGLNGNFAATAGAALALKLRYGIENPFD
jgi:hypothetical protein